MTSWLTRIDMNARNGAARADLGNTAGLHRRIMSLFPDHTGEEPRDFYRILHRLDIDTSGPRLLVQAGTEPQLDRLPDGYGTTAITDLDRLFERLALGQTVRYRILLNATKKVAKGEQAGKRIALGAPDTITWWDTRATANGLQLSGDPTLTASSLTGREPGGNKVTFKPWRLDGVANITNPDSVREFIVNGIGKGRAFGCGLLSVAVID